MNNYALASYRLFLITCLALGIGTLYLIVHKHDLEKLGLDLFNRIDSERSDDIYE